MQVYGIEVVMSNLQKSVDFLIYKTQDGCRKAMRHLKEESNKRTPVDTGDLRASAEVSDNEEKRNFVVALCYDTFYAVYVHEIPKRHKYAPTQDWKFLERAISESARTMIEIIQREARI